MIDRYKDEDIDRIWSYDRYLSKMVHFELCWASTLAEDVNKEMITLFYEDCTHKIDAKRILEIEKETKHETQAIILWMEERIKANPSLTKYLPFLHKDLTSSDVLDNVLQSQINDSLYVLKRITDEIISALRDLELKFGDLKTNGRTHGQVAKSMLVRQKINVYKDMMRTCSNQHYAGVEEGKIKGPVGTMYSKYESDVLWKFSYLRPATVCTQVLSRDRYARLASNIAILGHAMAKIANDIRLSAMTGVGEIKLLDRGHGSSSMPNKMNPAMEEKICGMSRLLDGHVITAMNNIELWHERDMSHSSTERIYIPDMFHTISHMGDTLITCLRSIEFVSIEENETDKAIEKFNSIMETGVDRSEAHSLVRKEYI